MASGWRRLDTENSVYAESELVIDGLQYFWVDTCCINESNNTEFQEVINWIMLGTTMQLNVTCISWIY